MKQAQDQQRTLAELIELLPFVVNRARVESASSKVGSDDHEALLDELVLDVQIDLEAVLPVAMRSRDAEGLTKLGTPPPREGRHFPLGTPRRGRHRRSSSVRFSRIDPE